MANMTKSGFVLKLSYGELLRRTRLQDETIACVRATVLNLFPSFQKFSLFYLDDDGDKICLDSDLELKEALVLSKTTAKGKKLLRLEVVPEFKRRSEPGCPSAPPLKEDVFSGVQLIFSSDEASLRRGASILKGIAGQVNEPECFKAYDSLLSHGAIPRIVELISSKNLDDAFTSDLATVLLNVASGKTEHTQAVLLAGAIPPLVNILRTSSAVVNKEIAVWALGNIAGDSVEARDEVLRAVKLPLVESIMAINNTEFLRNAAWLMMNLTRCKPSPPFGETSAFLPCLARLLKETDLSILTDVLWTLAYLTDGEDERIQHMVECGLHVPIMCLLKHHDPSVHSPALRTVSNLLTASDSTYTQSVLDLGGLGALWEIATRGEMSDRTLKECFFALSNVLAGTQGQIQDAIDLGFFPIIAKLLRESEDKGVQKELSFCLSNLAACGSFQQVSLMRSLGGFRLVKENGSPLSEKQENDFALWNGCMDLFAANEGGESQEEDALKEEDPQKEAAPPQDQVKDPEVEVLVSMGYEEVTAKAILECFEGDLFLALEQLP